MVSNPMDVVIPLGTGSTWQDNELRYALRSLEANCDNVGDIWIIGERPEFLNDTIRHIPVRDTSFPSVNIMYKTLRACKEPGISENFLFTNDDIFINTPLDIEKTPYLNRGISLSQAARMYRSGNYAVSIHNTAMALKERGLPDMHFDIHTPIIYNKQQFASVMEQYDWTIQHGYVIKSLYANSLRIPGVNYTDTKIKACRSHDSLSQIFQSQFVSIGERAVCKYLQSFLQEKYPYPSRFEH